MENEDDKGFLEGLKKKIDSTNNQLTSYNDRINKALNFNDHINWRDPLGWETLGQRWGEKTIGKKWREGQMQDIWNAVPEAWRPNIAKAAMSTAEGVGSYWQEARTIDNWFNPFELAETSTIRSLELVSLPLEGLAQLTSAGTGLDIELSRIVADFVPVGGAVNKIKLLRRANIAKKVTSKSSFSPGSLDDLLQKAVKSGNKKEIKRVLDLMDTQDASFIRENQILTSIKNKLDDQGNLFDDTVDLSATSSQAPIPKWGPDATREAAKQLFKGNTKQAREYFSATLAKKSGYESLKEFKRQILDQMPDKGEQIFRLLNESQYREGMVEHIVAKGKYMDWYWESWGLGKGDRHALTNVRLLYNDRFDKFKTTVEGIVRRTYQRTPKLEDRLIVGIENVGKSSKKVSGILIQNARNPGNIVIKRAGSGKVIGQLGQYLDALYPQDRALRAELLYQLQLRGIKGTKAVSQWRKKILEERLTKIVEKAHELPKSDKQARIIIQDAIEKDMVKFREEYHWLPQQKKLKFEDKPVIEPKTKQLRFPTKTEDLNPPGKGKSIPKSG